MTSLDPIENNKQLVMLLSELKVGVLPLEVFQQVARLVVLPILELVPLRVHGGAVEVLLLKRPINDLLWPSQWHTPGSVIRAYDEGSDASDALKRVINEELKGIKIGTPKFIKSLLNQNERGKEWANIFWAEVLEAPKVGEFFNSNSLPSNTMASQLSFINDAVNDFKLTKDLL